MIVVSDLTLNEGLYFRFLSMTAKSYLEMDVLIEAPESQIDYYYKILKKKGFYDYVSEILSPDKREEGVRLDTEHNYPLTVSGKSINWVKVKNLIRQKKMVRYIKKDKTQPLIWKNKP